MSIEQKKRLFASLPILQALGAVRCGFELETQAVDGRTWRDLQRPERESEPEFDSDRFNEAVSNATDEELSTRNAASVLVQVSLGARARIDNVVVVPGRSLATHLMRLWVLFLETAPDEGDDDVRPSDETRADSAALLAWATESDSVQESWDIRDVAELCGREGARVLDSIEEAIRDRVEETIDTTEFYSEVESDEGDDGDADFDVPSGIEAKPDGSVRGPEFIVKGNGVEAAQFSRLIKTLLRTFDVEVDTGCSFHVHVSVPGIKHTYGGLLQVRLMEYLLANVDRVPESVRERWRQDTRYFQPRVSRDKFSFVNFHERCGTWEFRCFGNVSTAKDAMRCLRLAVEALQFAYRVSLGLAESKFANEAEWVPAIYAGVIADSEHLDRVVRKERAKRHQSNRNAA